MELLILTEKSVNELIASLTKQWITDFFKTKSFITGDEIVAFASHKQVNHFILFQIYQDWNTFQSKLQHPFFDFKHEEVKKAMVEFHNVLSRHIKVERSEFRGMVEKAIYNNLKLIINPAECFANFFFQSKESIPITLFEKYANYFVDFDFIISSILSYHKKNNLQIVEKKVFVEKIDRVVQLYEEKQGQNFTVYRKAIFAQLTGYFWEDYINSNQVVEDPKTAIPQKEKTILKENKLITQFGEIDSELEIPVIQNSKIEDQVNQEVSKKHNILNSFIQTENSSKPRLIDQYKQSQQPNNLSLNKKNVTVEQIPLYKRFQFSQKMFQGNSEALKTCIEDLNDCETVSDLEYVLNKKYLLPNNLTLEDELALEFYQLFKRRFEN